MEKRGYNSHFKHIIGTTGKEILEPRKRFATEQSAMFAYKKMNNTNVTVYQCSYCNGYHIGK